MGERERKGRTEGGETERERGRERERREGKWGEGEQST